MKEAHAEPFLHPRHRLADRRRRHAKLPSRDRETSRFCGLNEGIQRSETVHPRTSTSDKRVRYVWNYGPFFKPSGEFISSSTGIAQRNRLLRPTPINVKYISSEGRESNG